MTSLLEMRMRGAGITMALDRYFQPTDSLPDTKGPLTSSTIREANEAVRSVATKQSEKRGSYAKFTPGKANRQTIFS